MCFVAAWIFIPALLAAPESSLKQAMREQQGQLFSTHAAWFKTNTQHGVWLQGFLKDASVGATRPTKDWSTALRRLVSLSKQEHLFHGSSGFIEDRSTLDILVAALGDSDRNTRRIALDFLTWDTRNRDLARLGDQIKPHVISSQREQDLLMCGKLALNQSERSALVMRSSQYLQIRARLGDTDAQRRLIESFRAERDYYRKSELARQLGYVGTKDAAAALVEALASDVSLKGIYDDRSIRCNVLLALGQIYQDEPLFTKDAHLIADNSDDVFDHHYGKAKYVKAVDTWVRREFGHQAWGTADVWFIRWRNVPSMQPNSKQ